MKVNIFNKQNHKIMFSAPGGDIYTLRGQGLLIPVRNNAAGLRCVCMPWLTRAAILWRRLSTVMNTTAHSTPGGEGMLRSYHKYTCICVSYSSTYHSRLQEIDIYLDEEQYLPTFIKPNSRPLDPKRAK
jgi:hypothetical protein